MVLLGIPRSLLSPEVEAALAEAMAAAVSLNMEEWSRNWGPCLPACPMIRGRAARNQPRTAHMWRSIRADADMELRNSRR